MTKQVSALALTIVCFALFAASMGTPSAPPQAPSVTFTVNSTDDVDDGICNGAHCSLREAIKAANATAAHDTIEFNIAGGGVKTIQPLDLTTHITRPVTIDGLSQPGASCASWPPTLLIELDGTNAHPLLVYGSGLFLDDGAAGSTIRGLVINRFTNAAGISTVADDVTVQCNFLGTNVAGTLLLSNGTGLLSQGASNNVIGGPAALGRNLISGNAVDGVFMGNGDGQIDHLIEGNYIGTNAAGTAALANGALGMRLSGGVGVVISGNLISGNTLDGLHIGFANYTTTIAANRVIGNKIGTNAAGTAAIPNRSGIFVTDRLAEIGDSGAGEGNLISGNTVFGVIISGTAATTNTLRGNYIGTNAAGTAALGNGSTGVHIDGARLNRIGGSLAGERNLISGNDGDGIGIENSGATTNTVQGNYIGTNAAGTSAIPNGQGGIEVLDADDNVIGGDNPGEGNVVSGNSGVGIDIVAASGTLVRGNRIGTTASGASALGNSFHGIRLQESNSANVIGGAAPGAGNVVSGNDDNGIDIESGTANVVQGNRIGTNAVGSAAVGNGGSGIVINVANETMIGGAAPGEGNLVSGNAEYGIHISGPAAMSNTLHGNKIGTNLAGNAALSNTLDGVRLSSYSTPNQRNHIGGTNAGEGNLISGNGGAGIYLTNTLTNTVRGNIIGLNLVGNAALPNDVGVTIGAPDHTLGGAMAGARNVIAGNTGAGVAVLAGANKTTIQGNFIGTNLTGTADVGNGGPGVSLGSEENLVGGESFAVPLKRNVISGNDDGGVLVSGEKNLVRGNYIGSGADGGAVVGNLGDGVLIKNGDDHVIGGNAGEGNVIAGNQNNGVRQVAGGVFRNKVLGNWIGIRPNGTPSANGGGGGNGVLVEDGYLTVKFNHIVNNGRNPGDYGVKVATSGDVTIEDNNIFGNVLPEGPAYPQIGATVSGTHFANHNYLGMTPSSSYTPTDWAMWDFNKRLGAPILLRESGEIGVQAVEVDLPTTTKDDFFFKGVAISATNGTRTATVVNHGQGGVVNVPFTTTNVVGLDTLSPCSNFFDIYFDLLGSASLLELHFKYDIVDPTCEAGFDAMPNAMPRGVYWMMPGTVEPWTLIAPKFVGPVENTIRIDVTNVSSPTLGTLSYAPFVVGDPPPTVIYLPNTRRDSGSGW